ncbi:hypothetical protein GGR51DRAFT_527084 [Nemania sp. FL0031]|nr:hypothetical protein GGR51DRAFT_527084 [Nemania sp. FL0031]
MPPRAVSKIFPRIFREWASGYQSPNDSAQEKVDDISEAKPLGSWDARNTPPPSSEYAVFNQMIQDGSIKGLSNDEAARIRAQCGPNESTHDRNRFNLRSFSGSVIAQSIVIAIALSALTSVAEGRWIGLAIVYPLLLARAVLAVYVEHNASSTASLLNEKVALSSLALRNGIIDRVNTSELVPGDIVQLSEYSPVFADGRVLAATESFTVNEAPVPGVRWDFVRMGKGDMVYASSVVKSGEALILVTAIGNKRRDASPRRLLTPPPLHHDEILDKAYRYGMTTAAFVVFLTWVSAFSRPDYHLVSFRVTELLRPTFSILLVGIPIGLTAVVISALMGVALFLGAHGCLVRHLSVIEDIAGVDTLCCDNTGTFTRNQLQTLQPWPVILGVRPRDILVFASLVTSRNPKEHDAIDRAILEAVRGSQVDVDQFRQERFFPFDPYSKKASSVVRTPTGETWCICKGAPLFVLKTVTDNSQSPTLDLPIQRYRATLDRVNKSGYMCLGVARHKCTADGTIIPDYSQILGLIPFIDLAHPDTLERIVDMRQLGLDIKLFSLSGNPVVERLSYGYGLGTTVYQMGSLDLLASSRTLEEYKKNQRIFYDRIKDADAFSEVFPQHKYNVVETLENNARRVAVTADAANECLVLRRATVGIAVCGAADGARAAADVVLLNQGLRPIADVIQISRRAFHAVFTQISYRVALACHMLLCFAGWAVFSIGRESSHRIEMLDVNLVVLIALFSDCFTIAMVFEKAICPLKPLSWSRMTPFGTAMTATIVTFYTCITMVAIPVHGQEHFSVPERNMEAVLFLQIVLSQSLLSLITRPDPLWVIKPPKEFSACVISVNILATIISYLWGSFSRHPPGSNPRLVWDILYVWKMSFGFLCVGSGIYNLRHCPRLPPPVLPKLNVNSFVK